MRLSLLSMAAFLIVAGACARRPPATVAPPPAPAPIAAPVPTPEALALRAAEPWLRLVDNGQYLESWDDAATAFKAAITRDAWQSAVSAAVGPLGKLKSRNLGSSQYTENLPGAPAGKYVVLQYNSAFTEGSAVETVVLVLDTDRSWRVSGYFVQ
ncbi:MAG: DUF4019 domain-containing protein [Anaerolineae bacterium]|nr:DUF4019 domain-containing protein [Gemmatimonadaceae bacterium]